jgi:hypothetical protein
MENSIYLLSWVAGLCALWFLWSLGIKPLVLDFFRERLFELRFQLFRLGMNGELDFGNDTYRTLETLLCGLIRFSHRITFLTFIFSLVEQEKAKKEKGYADLGQQIALKISRLDPDTQTKLKALLTGVRSAIILYLVFSSVLFMTIIFLYYVRRLVGLGPKTDDTDEISSVVEREAYRAEYLRGLRVAHA